MFSAAVQFCKGCYTNTSLWLCHCDSTLAEDISDRENYTANALETILVKWAIYTVWVKKVPPLNFLRYCHLLWTYVTKILVIAQIYAYIHTDFRPFIWIFAWIVSLLLAGPLKF